VLLWDVPLTDGPSERGSGLLVGFRFGYTPATDSILPGNSHIRKEAHEAN